MRGVTLFLAGIIVGSLTTTPIAQSGRRLLGLNHVAISVPDVEKAAAFYMDTFGMQKAFEFRDANGAPTLMYLQISRDTFLELQPTTAERPAGVMHIGFQVEDMAGAVTALKRSGSQVPDPAVSERTKARMAQTTDPHGVRLELLDLGPESLQRKAMNAWK